MPLVLADRVKDTTTTTGTGTITLSGTAPIGYVSFGTAIGNANTTYYTITAGSEWEVGLGTYTAAGLLLSRDTVLASSAGGTTKVTFSAGTKDVFVTYPAGKAIYEDGSDNVGIGTLTPGARLDVSGNIRLSAANPNIELNNGGPMVYSPGVANTLAFATGGGPGAPVERMRIDSSGNLLLGTTTTKNRLTVAAAGVANAPTLGTAGGIAYLSNNDPAYGLTIGTTTSDGHVWLQAQRTDGTATAYNITLNEAGGNVGIGTTSISYKLEVGGDVRIAGSGGDLRLQSATGTTTSGGDSSIYNDANNMIFNTGTTAAERMRIDSVGNVGIGTASPGALLQLNKASGAADLRLSVGGTLYTNIYASSSDVNVLSITAIPLIFGTNNTERMRVTNSGDVLVGTTTSFGKFSVFGTAGFNADANVTVPGSGSYKFRGAAGTTTITTVDYLNYTAMQFIRDNGNPTNTVGSITCTDTATTYNTSSDRRLKKDIAPAADAGSVIDAIEIVSHGWKQGEGVVPFGVIAQDLHAVVPQAVHAGDDADEIESVWGVDYSKLVPILVKEIQSLRARVAQLEGN